MEHSLLSIQTLVTEVKKEIFSTHTSSTFATFVTPSAYDTAWLAMIPDHSEHKNGPMFKSCLNWIIENQKEEGFWGETNEEGLPTIDALTATLACLIALKTWNAGGHDKHIELGLAFIHSKADIVLLKLNSQNLPRSFVLTFPAMIELAEAAGLDLDFPPENLREVVAAIFIERQHILDTEELVDESSQYWYPPLLSYLETLPSTYHFDRQNITKHLSYDGSLFQSPSATASAFMETGNLKCMNYLQSLLQEFPNGVPAKYPMDEDLIKLCMVDQVQRLGVAEHFNHEIEKILAQVYRNQIDYMSKPTVTSSSSSMPAKLFKDALAFRLLRMQEHSANPGNFCWFLHESEVMTYMEENFEQFISAMYSVYRATDLQFPGENELEEARTFAIKMLEKSINTRNRECNFLISEGLQNMIKYELSVPWIARLDHLYNRMWIEENKISPLWIGKASFYRLSCLENKNLMQLAVENFELRQSVYRDELEELKRWSKKWRLSEMGFGREKTTVTYFASAASSCFPYNSNTRLEMAKAAIIITVADDFYDMEGSLSELETLTDAVIRWDGKGLEGHGKTIFDALHDFVDVIAAKSLPQETSMPMLQDIWRETFMSWMVESRWSLTGYVPSMKEYLQTGVISTAVHTIVLPSTTFVCQNGTQKPTEYHNITKLLMETARLVNDTQSYQKEAADGKMNFVLLYLNENPNITIEDSVTYVKHVLEVKTKEFMKHVFIDDDEMYSKSYKSIHLSSMKVFRMLFNTENLYDSETALLDAIDKALYLPISHKPKFKPLVRPLASVPQENKRDKEIARIISSVPFEKTKSKQSLTSPINFIQS